MRYQPSPDVRATLKETSSVLLDLQRGTYLSLNKVGTLIWRAIEAGATREGIIDQVSSRFGASRDKVTADVDSFLTNLNGRGLIRPVA